MEVHQKRKKVQSSGHDNILEIHRENHIRTRHFAQNTKKKIKIDWEEENSSPANLKRKDDGWTEKEQQKINNVTNKFRKKEKNLQRVTIERGEIEREK